MDAVIYRSGRDASGMIDVAGEPLVTRQLQWLRAAGCERVAVEVGPGPAAQAQIQRLSWEDSLGADVMLIASGRALGAPEVARRAGFSVSAPLLAITDDTLGDGDLALFVARAAGDGALGRLPAPLGTAARLEAGFVRLLRPNRPTRLVVGPGWGCRLRTPADGFTLGMAALRGRLPQRGGVHECPIQVHATEDAPGIFLARGAVCDEGAILVAPVLLGRRSIVRAGAEIGPDAILGTEAVVEGGAIVREALVRPNTLVGRDACVRRQSVSPEGIHEFDTGLFDPIRDADLLTSRRRPPWSPRLFAIALGLLLALPYAFALALGRLRDRPCFVRVQNPHTGAVRHEGVTGLALFDLLPRLFDVASGARCLVGILVPTTHVPEASETLEASASAAPLGAFGIDRALTEGTQDSKARLRAHAWYASAKCPRTDASLLLQTLRGRS